jgi:hypothetical protein
MRAPSTRTLVLLAIVSFVATSLLIPNWYPPAIPVTGADGAVMHAPDGKVLFHRDLTEFNREAIPGEICFLLTLVFSLWLVIRFFRFLYARWTHKNTTA